MTVIEKCASEDFVCVVRNLLGNRESEGYIKHIEQLLIHFQRLSCIISIKPQYLYSHLNFFP